MFQFQEKKKSTINFATSYINLIDSLYLIFVFITVSKNFPKGPVPVEEDVV